MSDFGTVGEPTAERIAAAWAATQAAVGIGAVDRGAAVEARAAVEAAHLTSDEVRELEARAERGVSAPEVPFPPFLRPGPTLDPPPESGAPYSQLRDAHGHLRAIVCNDRVGMRLLPWGVRNEETVAMLNEADRAAESAAPRAVEAEAADQRALSDTERAAEAPESLAEFERRALSDTERAAEAQAADRLAAMGVTPPGWLTPAQIEQIDAIFLKVLSGTVLKSEFYDWATKMFRPTDTCEEKIAAIAAADQREFGRQCAILPAGQVAAMKAAVAQQRALVEQYAKLTAAAGLPALPARQPDTMWGADRHLPLPCHVSATADHPLVLDATGGVTLPDGRVLNDVLTELERYKVALDAAMKENERYKQALDALAEADERLRATRGALAPVRRIHEENERLRAELKVWRGALRPNCVLPPDGRETGEHLIWWPDAVPVPLLPVDDVQRVVGGDSLEMAVLRAENERLRAELRTIGATVNAALRE